MRFTFKQNEEYAPLRYNTVSGMQRTSPSQMRTPEVPQTYAVTQLGSEQESRASKVGIFSNRSDLMIALSRVSMHLQEELRKDITKQTYEILNPENINYDGCVINVLSFEVFLKFVATKKIRSAGYSVSARGNFMASWFNEEDRIHIEFINEYSSITTVSKKDKNRFEYFSHSGDLFALERFLKINNFSEWVYET